jgi:hypothetical protein
MSDKYILNGQEAIPCEDLLTWGRWFETAERHVAQKVIGDVRVSTVFLGLDHKFGSDGPPLIFETMIFGGEHDGYQERYSTWEQAEEGHKRALALVAA